MTRHAQPSEPPAPENDTAAAGSLAVLWSVSECPGGPGHDPATWRAMAAWRADAHRLLAAELDKPAAKRRPWPVVLATAYGARYRQACGPVPRPLALAAFLAEWGGPGGPIS